MSGPARRTSHQRLDQTEACHDVVPQPVAPRLSTPLLDAFTFVDELTSR